MISELINTQLSVRSLNTVFPPMFPKNRNGYLATKVKQECHSEYYPLGIVQTIFFTFKSTLSQDSLLFLSSSIRLSQITISAKTCYSSTISKLFSFVSGQLQNSQFYFTFKIILKVAFLPACSLLGDKLCFFFNSNTAYQRFPFRRWVI